MTTVKIIESFKFPKIKFTMCLAIDRYNNNHYTDSVCLGEFLIYENTNK